jgi:hypothetical protein
MSANRKWQACTVCLVVAVLIYIYAGPITLLFDVRSKIRDDPKMWIVPTPLNVKDNPHAHGKVFSYYGYEFESPWTELKEERKYQWITMIYFSGGQVITILDPAQNVDELQLLREASPKQTNDLTRVFGEEATQSRYAFASKMWSVTPADLRLFSTRKQIVTSSVFLLLKHVSMKRIKGGLYSFETSSVRGIQQGNPAQDDLVIVDTFDLDDHKLEFWVGSERSATSKPSQEDIDRVLYSLRLAPATQLDQTPHSSD